MKSCWEAASGLVIVRMSMRAFRFQKRLKDKFFFSVFTLSRYLRSKGLPVPLTIAFCMGLSVHTQNIWGTMAHLHRDLGANRCLPSHPRYDQRAGHTWCLPPDMSRRGLCEVSLGRLIVVAGRRSIAWDCPNQSVASEAQQPPGLS